MNLNRLNEYVNINFIKNKYSKYRLSTILKKINDEDRLKIVKRVRCFCLNNAINNRKQYFIHQNYVHLITSKQLKTKSDTQLYFATIRACKGQYNEQFLKDFMKDLKSLKKSKAIEYVIEGKKNNAHLHFTIQIAKKELVRIIKKLLNTNKYRLLKYFDMNLQKVQKDFFKKTQKTMPIYIKPVNEVKNLGDYLNKQNTSRII